MVALRFSYKFCPYAMLEPYVGLKVARRRRSSDKYVLKKKTE
jgi:hypothetical protein